MPLIKRGIEPVHVSRGVVPTSVRNELEYVSNNTLANVILQLSSLSKHAEDVFGELHKETCCVLYRTGQLTDRIDRLKQKILQLNPTVEEVSLQDINMRKPFRSSVIKDQQIVASTSRSQAIVEKYNECEPPPALHKLDPYREDGKRSIKFYTDPAYFFELWCQEMALDTENQLKKQKHRNKKVRPTNEVRTIRQPHNHIDEYRDLRHGPEFVEKLRHEHGDGTEDYQTSSSRTNGSLSERGSMRPSSLEIQKLSQTAQAYLTGQGTRASEYGYIFNNGPLARQTSKEPPLDHNVSSMPSHYRSINNYQEGYRDVQATGYRDHDAAIRSNSAYQEVGGPSGRELYSPNSRGQSMNVNSPAVGGSRPSLPPPAPPGGTPSAVNQQQISRSASLVTRDTLPPPPPTPQSQQSDIARQQHRTQYFPADTIAGQTGYSSSASPKGKSSQNFDLPPPPTPPPFSSPFFVNAEPMPSPPSIPPPTFNMNDSSGMMILPPPISSPSQPVAGSPAVGHKQHRNESGGSMLIAPPVTDYVTSRQDGNTLTHPEDDMSGASSLNGVGSRVDDGVMGGKSDKPMVRDTRCDLLSAIREGLQLRKVEERRLKTEQKQQTTGRLDVQSIMEAAFEMRRKALESNDSDKEDDDDDGNWSDDG